MIIDLHTRVWDSIEAMGPAVAATFRRRREEPWQHISAPEEAHAEAMRPVAFAAVLGFESGLLEGSIDAERVHRAVKSDPTKNLGFVGIDPTLGKAVAKLEEALEMGLVGATVSPAAAGFHPADTRAMELYEACEARGVPVLIEGNAMLTESVDLAFAQPYLLDEVARTFPDLKIVMSSFGLPWIDQGVALMAKHPGIYADVSGLVLRSWQLYNALVQAYQSGVMNQVLFGSNFPFCDPEKAIVTLYSVNTTSQGTPLPSVPREQLRSVVERDTLAELGIERPAGSASGPDTPDAEAGDDESVAESEFEKVAIAEDKPA
ncbi:MAG: amidohydrolase family protein [Planctomycetota bacterium]